VAHENELSLVFVSMSTPGSPGVSLFKVRGKKYEVRDLLKQLLPPTHNSLLTTHNSPFPYLHPMKTPLFSLIIMILLSACGKSAAEKDKTYPVVSISSPTAGQVYTPGQLIPINASITDETYIAEVHVHVSNTNTGELLMDVHDYPAGKTGSISQTITAASGVNYKIQVIAKDRAVNETRSTVEVTCN
jgi:hypothetical protein